MSTWLDLNQRPSVLAPTANRHGESSPGSFRHADVLVPEVGTGGDERAHQLDAARILDDLDGDGTPDFGIVKTKPSGNSCHGKAMNDAWIDVHSGATGDALTSLRSRATSFRPLTVVREMEAAAQKQYFGRLKALEDERQKTMEKLQELQKARGASAKSAQLLTPEQQLEIENLKKKEGKVTLVGFGTFSKGRRKARKGRNPQTGAEIKIKASTVVRFKAGKKLKDAV